MNFKPKLQSGLEQFTMAAFTCAAVASLAYSQKAPLAWVFLAPCVVALFWRVQRLPSTVVRWTRYVAWTILGGTVLLGLLHRAYPILSDEAVRQPLTIAGFGLSFFAATFLLGTGLWPPARTLFPSTLGILLIAALNPNPPHWHALLMVAGAAAFIYLLVHGRPHHVVGSPGKPKGGEFSRPAISGSLVFLIAWGIIQLLPWLQVRVVQATNRLVVPTVNFFPGLSQVSRLGDLEELQLSQKVVMRVWTSRPQKLRGRVFTVFEGKAWHTEAGAGKRLMPSPQDSFIEHAEGEETNGAASLAAWLESIPGNSFVLPRGVGRSASPAKGVRTLIIQEVFNGGMLVMPGNKLMVRLKAPYLREDIFENLTQPPLSPVEIYGVVNLPQGNLAQASSGNEELLKSCLALPDDTDSRLKELAERLKSGAKSPAERIQKTLNYLQSKCQYSLKVGKFHSAQPVAEFLFEKKRGYCEYFASAAAVLLRLEGVPSRYVTGFNLQDGNREGSHYVVREADAHAWIEAYVPNQGWVEIDPTPESEYQALHSNHRDGWLAASIEWLATIYVEVASRLGQGDWLLTVQWIWGGIKALVLSLFVGWRNRSLLVLALVLSAAIFFVRRRKISPAGPIRQLPARETSSVPSDLHELMRRLDMIWARAGLSRPASRAPLEHLTGIPDEKLSPALRDSGRHIIEYYYRISFGGIPHSTKETRELRLKLERAEKT
jgi:Transglutaminase-like superfamily